MPRTRVIGALVALAAIGAAAPACLPTDTRTPPGSLYTSVTGSDMTVHGIAATEDGWKIVFERVLVGIGRVDLGGSGCNRYSNRGYMRLLDLGVPGPQKLNIAYALGQCRVSFRLSYPGNDAVPGARVTGADRTFMNTPHPDGYEDPSRAGIAVYVKGTATRAGTIKHFAWAFRRRIQYARCGNDATDAGPRGFFFHSHDAFRADIAIHAEALFQDRRDPATAKLHFQPYADADTVTGNNDGIVTLDELGKVQAADAGIQDLSSSNLGGIGGVGTLDAGLDAGRDARSDAVGLASSVTLEDYVYLRLVPVMTRYKDIVDSCSAGDVPSGRF